MKRALATSPLFLGLGVAIVGLIASTTIALSLHGTERRNEERKLENKTDLLAVQISSEVRRYVDTTQSLAASLGTRSDLHLDDFNSVTAPIQAEQLNGIESVAFVVAADDSNIASVQQRWRDQGYPELQLMPFAGSSTHYFPVYQKSFHDDIVATSNAVDLGRYSEVVSALTQSESSKQVVVSRGLVDHANNSLFAQDQDPTIALVAPAFDSAAATPDGFKGWVVVGLRAQDIVVEILNQSDIKDFDEISVSGISGDGHPISIGKVGNCSNISRNLQACEKPHGVISSHSVEVAQDLWTVETSTTPATPFFDDGKPLMSGLILVSGAIGGVLIGVLVYVLAGGRKRALALVDLRTRELQDDIRRREVIERRLELARAETEQQKADLDAFAGFAAHDLKAPLTVISGYIGLIREAIGDQSKFEGQTLLEYCDRTERSSTRMRALIDSLLMFAKARDVKLEPEAVDLARLAQISIDENLEQQRAEQADVREPEVSLETPIPMVCADRELTHQLLHNLISNSLKYVPAGETPCIAMAARKIENEMVEVTFADHGIGIPEDRRKEVFAGFVRAHNTAGYSGTGLGLALCKRIVERHGGTIHVEENPGGGAKFIFSLPGIPDQTRSESEIGQTTHIQ